MPRRPPSAADALDLLREWVEVDGRSIRSIAAAGGLPQPTLSRVLSGRRLDPNLSTVAAMLVALGRTWADLD